MGILEDIWRAITSGGGDPDIILKPDEPTVGDELIQDVKDTLGVDDSARAKKAQDILDAKKFLAAEAVILGIVIGAPIGYAAYSAFSSPPRKKRTKAQIARDERMFEAFSNASTRASSVLASFGPSFAIPATYITVQKLEDAEYITKGLGDAVQTILTTAAAAGLVGSISNMATPIIKSKVLKG